MQIGLGHAKGDAQIHSTRTVAKVFKDESGTEGSDMPITPGVPMKALQLGGKKNRFLVPGVPTTGLVSANLCIYDAGVVQK
jgi:hypothetical protein